jgi:hypothetical protein
MACRSKLCPPAEAGVTDVARLETLFLIKSSCEKKDEAKA